MINDVDPSLLEWFLERQGLPIGPSQRNLGKVVILAGANGSGKSRYLRALGTALDAARDAQGKVREQYVALMNSQPKGSDVEAYHAVIRAIDARSAFSWDGKPNDFPVCIRLTHDTSKRIDDDRQQTTATRSRIVQACASTIGFSSAFTGQHVYVAKIARDIFGGGHATALEDTELSQRAEDAKAFNGIVQALLGAEVGFGVDASSEQIPTLFGREYAEKELSSGQKILLAWAIILHRQRASLENAIVLIDEPENHLHPDVCIRALERLRDGVLGQHGQIWLATHSIPLIAWAGADALHAVSNGSVAYAGNAVADVINSLAGGPSGREQLRTFLADADQFGFFHFIAECLGGPGVVASKDGDPQEHSFAALVGELLKTRARLRVLDFGSGRGRLADALSKCFAEQPELARLDYFGFDPSAEHLGERERAVARLVAAGGSAAVNIERLGTLQVTGNGVDLVVLCNVLHEIPTSEWQSTLADCRKVLSVDGSLVVIEDQYPSVGELPHDRGFVLLDYSEMAQMFGGKDSVVDLSVTIDPRHRERITVFELYAVSLSHFSIPQMNSALGIVRDRARRELKRLRGEAGEQRQRAGRLHALHAMLWMSAKFALGDD